ncbi:sensor histidine kinase [Streptomyces sp. NPDC048172]|uniref:sensor histidine kinase n=1 Tax=Streptomyces sp. NPDC048172 TaxID=3365505 RepID=UPI00371CADAE
MELRRLTAGRRADVALALLLTGVTVVLRLNAPLPDGSPARTVLALALLVGATAPLAWRRTRPWPVLAASVACYVTGELLDPLGDNAQAPMLACYSVARHTSAPRSLAAPAVLLAALLGPELAGDVPRLLSAPEASPPLGYADVFVAALLCGAGWLLGASRRRLYADAARLRDLAERLRAEQRLSAERAVTAERARIARDLHDLVAHHVSAIALQARAAEVVLPEDPRTAGEGVAAIGRSADTALEEMRGLVRLLADAPSPGAPEPSLAHLDRLAADAGAAGCPVALTVVGPASALPPAVQVSAYRIVQEALTNVRKHAGPVPVRVELLASDAELTVRVENAAPPGAPPPRSPGSGLGLVGMRERAALFGGTLRAGPTPEGGWRIEATMGACA